MYRILFSQAVTQEKKKKKTEQMESAWDSFADEIDAFFYGYKDYLEQFIDETQPGVRGFNYDYTLTPADYRRFLSLLLRTRQPQRRHRRLLQAFDRLLFRENELRPQQLGADTSIRYSENESTGEYAASPLYELVTNTPQLADTKFLQAVAAAEQPR